jgi:membrane-bound serine protease (ClpP class)
MIKINSLKGCVSQSKDEKELIGKEMIVYSDLRPAGTALYRGNRFDVISVGEFHKKGTTVIVDKVDGNRIIAMRK